mgnify:CR=1 FL=1
MSCTPVPVRQNFNPRSPCGERRCCIHGCSSFLAFQSTLPVWGATTMHKIYTHLAQFQSTLPVWGATDAACPAVPDLGISIHAPRVGSDYVHGSIVAGPNDFNPRSPCGERRPCVLNCAAPTKFQSTLPVWGATGYMLGNGVTLDEFQSTLPVWGATIHPVRCHHLWGYFNPRSPCGERLADVLFAVPQKTFQSTLPVWGATSLASVVRRLWNNFNPRSPCGERPPQRNQASPITVFQSTLPVWGATGWLIGLAVVRYISIHAPRVGSDQCQRASVQKGVNFNPRSPCGERRQR